ncbi:hypothetical protein [Marinobacterium sp. BA1]|uniref:hypothetical protein n=1 Tax=Marinobacterium sp. BA1 TaxID=3138931 RepID=UPI0032E7E073
MIQAVKQGLRHTYPLLIISGLITGPFGLLAELLVLAAVGNSAFLAGFLTPVIMMRKLKVKDAVLLGVWSATVAYFAVSGDVAEVYLLAAAPLLLCSIGISKWSGLTFIAPAEPVGN